MPSSATGAVRSRRRVTKRAAGTRWAPYLFLSPFTVLFLLFLVAPIGVAIWNSVHATKSSGLGFGTAQTLFVGVENYTRALRDEDFLTGFGRVALYGIVQVPVMMIFAGALALLFDSAVVKAKRFFQFSVFLPYAVPGVIAALLWGFLYQPSVSPLIGFFRDLGIDADLLAPGTILWSVANVSVWSYTGINMIILYTALQTVPREMYESAVIDGAGQVRIAWSIKLPMIAPAIVLTTLSSIIGTLQLFNEPQVLRSITNNIASDWTPNMAVYSAATDGRNSNLSSAMAIVLGVVTLIISLVVLRLTNRKTMGAGNVA